MLRVAIAARTSVGRLADQYMSAGQLVPDPVILRLVEDRLEEPDCASGALFDGFPRTIGQAQALDEYLQAHGRPLDVVVELRLPDAVVVDRLSRRGRSDDSPEVVAERLRAYWALTKPLTDYYLQRGLLEAIEGRGTTDEVFERIKSVIDLRHRTRPVRHTA